MTKPATVPIPDAKKIRQDIETELFLRRGDDRSDAAIGIAVRESVGLQSQIQISNDLRERIAQLEQRNAELVASETALKRIVNAAVAVRIHGSDYKDGTHAGFLWRLVGEAIQAAEDRRKRAEGGR